MLYFGLFGFPGSGFYSFGGAGLGKWVILLKVRQGCYCWKINICGLLYLKTCIRRFFKEVVRRSLHVAVRAHHCGEDGPGRSRCSLQVWVDRFLSACNSFVHSVCCMQHEGHEFLSLYVSFSAFCSFKLRDLANFLISVEFSGFHRFHRCHRFQSYFLGSFG